MMEICMKDNFQKIKCVDMEYIEIIQVFNIEAIGKMMLDKDKGRNMIMANQFTKVLIKMEKNMEQADINGLMGIIMKDNGKTIIFLEMVFMVLRTEEGMKDNGLTI